MNNITMNVTEKYLLLSYNNKSISPLKTTIQRATQRTKLQTFKNTSGLSTILEIKREDTKWKKKFGETPFTVISKGTTIVKNSGDNGLEFRPHENILQRNVW